MKKSILLVLFSFLVFGNINNAFAWTQVYSDGFGDPNNTPIKLSVSFDGYLYAGCSNVNAGCEIWRSANGTTWNLVMSGGFGDSSNIGISLINFKNCLYAAISDVSDDNITGVTVWRSVDGTNFNKVSPDGFGNSSNVNCNLGYFGDYLYAGTDKDDEGGGELLRSSDGSNWTPVTTDGFGNINNEQIYVSPFLDKNTIDGYFYVGTENEATGCEIWRSLDGSAWTQVISNGFGDPCNEDAQFFAVFKDCLYVATMNPVTGSELWKSSNGINFVQVGAGGFGDMNNGSLIPNSVSGDYLYVGTFNASTGQLWKSNDGINFDKDAQDGFGDINNFAIFPPTITFNGFLYTATINDSTGGEVWRQPTDADVNGDGIIDLADEILTLKIISGIDPAQTIYFDADVNDDNKIGIEEAIYILEKVAGLKD